MFSFQKDAVATGFETEIARYGKPDSYWKELSEMLERKRDKMAKFLSEVGMAPVMPDGGYFMIADFSVLGKILFNVFYASVLSVLILKLCRRFIAEF